MSAALLALLLLVPAPLVGQTQRYPVTKKVDVAEDYHGTMVPDAYRWLEDTNSEETRAWIAAQNEVTFGYLSNIPEREMLRRRLTQLWDYPRYGVPFRSGGRYFFYKNDGLQNQSVLYVQPTLAAEPRVLLDPNTLSPDGTIAVSEVSVSRDGRLLGYGLAAAGSDWQEFRVRDIATGKDLADRIRWVKFSGLSWTRDARGFFYSRYPETTSKDSLLAANRDQKLYYHVLGQPQELDRLLYERPDQPEWGFGADVTYDGRYALVYVWHGTDPRNRLYTIDLKNANKPDLASPVVRLLDEYDASYSVIGNEGPLLYVLTDLDAPRRRVIAIDLREPARTHWRTIVPEGDDVLESARVIGGRIVAEYLQDAKSRVRLFALSGAPAGEVQLPTLGSIRGISGRPDSPEMFYGFTSFLYPTTIFRTDVRTGEQTVFHAPELDIDPARYDAKQVFFTSRDGTRVPMFIVHRKGIALDGSNPTYLYGYGGFNISQTPSFSVTNLLWLELGGIYALPNLRGGGEYGEEWHKAGTKERKQNVFDDFIAAAEYLIREGYTSPAKLAIGGGSNGGLLVGAAMTQRPELFAVAHPAVGVMDMLRYHKFTIGWAWVSDYGSSDDPEGFRYLQAYSPLHSLKPRTCYPATLVTTADHDDRVVPGHSFKFAAALQAAQSCERPTLIRIQVKAGHGAGKPTRFQIEEAADVLAFRIKNLGMKVELASD
ncbi:MAG: S9 family peptidase [Gemmatimonadetes bacterium]|nr:S9 family peptidase [Gemmatimonadota bacterium]